MPSNAPLFEGGLALPLQTPEFSVHKPDEKQSYDQNQARSSIYRQASSTRYK